MYKIKLSNYNKKIERSIKGLKKGKEYSLTEADSYVKQIHGNTNQRTNLLISVVDYETDNEYEFNKGVIDPSESTPNLIEMLQEELLNEEGLDRTFVNKLLHGLEDQYEQEKLNPTTENNTPSKKKGIGLFKGNKKSSSNKDVDRAFENTFDVPEKGLFSFGNKKKKNKKQTIENSEVADSYLEDDFEELDSLVETEELEDNNDEFIEVAEENIYSNEKESLEEDQHDSDEYDPFGDEEEYDPFDEENSTTSDSYEGLEGKEETEEPEYQSKSNEVYFPEYDKFLDMSMVEKTIQRQNDRLEKEHLVKFLGLNALSKDTALTDLDNLKLTYALSSLEESKFVLIRDYFNTSVQNIKDKTQNGLSQIYEQVMSFDYQEEAKKELKENLEQAIEQTEAEYAKYQSGQEEEYNQRLSKFQLEQEKALQDFIRQQEVEKNQFIQELEIKKDTRLNVYKDDMQNKLIVLKDKLIDDKVVELKYNSINSMSEAKRRSIRSFEAELDNAVDDTWEKTQIEIEALKGEIEKRIPLWKEEIEEKRKIEAERREEARKEEALSLERKRIELQQKQLEFSKNKKVENEETKIAEMLEKRFEMYDTKFAESLQKLSTTNENEQEKPKKQLMGSAKIKKYVTAGTIVALMLGGGAVVGTVANQQTQSKAYAETQSESSYPELAKTIQALEAKLSETEETKEESVKKEDLDSLLAEKNYEKAMSLYKEQEQLEKIEETLYKNKDLAYLVTFNKVNETKYGGLDEAILSKDDKKIVDIYQSLPDDVKKALTDERKSAIANSLYHMDQNDLANKLLAKGEKE